MLISMALSGKKRQGRSGIVLRVDITPEEHKQIRILAIDRGTTVPKLIAALIREALKRKR